jgi:hypothetical protein
MGDYASDCLQSGFWDAFDNDEPLTCEIKSTDCISFDAVLVRETPKAWMLEISSDKTFKGWLPKSQCSFEDGKVLIPIWLILQKGLHKPPII